jgi:hypothetical protein
MFPEVVPPKLVQGLKTRLTLHMRQVLLEQPSIEPDAATLDGVRPIERACYRNHAEITELLLVKGVSSVVNPSLWVGLKFGTWLLRKQLPEVVAKQRALEEAEAAVKAAEDERKAQAQREREEKEKEAREASKQAAVKEKEKGKKGKK